MCGIIGLLLATDETANVNQLLFDGLTVLQHRGQDAAGMVTMDRKKKLHLRKENGLVKDVFERQHMKELLGNMGLGHCRYPTAGSSSCAEAQPLYTNYPYGICVAHNGNLTNTRELMEYLEETALRHINTESDSELLLNLFAEQLMKETQAMRNADPSQEVDMKKAIFLAMTELMAKCKGGYAGMFLINNYGLVGFRDPNGIRPLVFGCRESAATMSNDSSHSIPGTPGAMDHAAHTLDYVIASESVAIDTLGFRLVRDVKAGEAIFIDMEGNCHSQMVHPNPVPAPCIFEYVYFARPDSIMDGVSVYETRLRMGQKLAEKIIRERPDHGIDVVIPIPDTSRTAALQLAYVLDKPFREGFIKNRYIARTFIMPGQATRRKSVRLKLNTIKPEFANRNVLLVDDSIVRGTTASEIVQMARDAGAKNVFFCSAAPPVRYPNIYGIDIPTQHELIAFKRNEAEIAEKIGCDWVIYQDLEDLEAAVCDDGVPRRFESSCFSGNYVTGETITDDYFSQLHDKRNDDAKKRLRTDSVASVAAPKRSSCESISNDKTPRTDGESACESITRIGQ